MVVPVPIRSMLFQVPASVRDAATRLAPHTRATPAASITERGGPATLEHLFVRVETCLSLGAYCTEVEMAIGSLPRPPVAVGFLASACDSINTSAFIYDLRQVALLEGTRLHQAYTIDVVDRAVMLERGWRPPVVEPLQTAERSSASSPAANFWPVPAIHVTWTRSPDDLPCPCIVLPRSLDDPIVKEFLTGDAVTQTKDHLWSMGFDIRTCEELWESSSPGERLGRFEQAQRLRNQAAGRLAGWTLTGFRTPHGMAFDQDIQWMPPQHLCFPEAYALGCGTGAGAQEHRRRAATLALTAFLTLIRQPPVAKEDIPPIVLQVAAGMEESLRSPDEPKLILTEHLADSGPGYFLGSEPTASARRPRPRRYRSRSSSRNRRRRVVQDDTAGTSAASSSRGPDPQTGPAPHVSFGGTTVVDLSPSSEPSRPRSGSRDRRSDRSPSRSASVSRGPSPPRGGGGSRSHWKVTRARSEDPIFNFLQQDGVWHSICRNWNNGRAPCARDPECPHSDQGVRRLHVCNRCLSDRHGAFECRVPDADLPVPTGAERRGPEQQRAWCRARGRAPDV